MKTLLKLGLVIGVLALGAFSAPGLIPDDTDGDGVPDSVDVCPSEDASGFDRDGDGCIDLFIGARHIEYWSTEDAVIQYVINEQGVPAIVNGSDLTAVQSAVGAWMGVADTDLNFVYDGTTSQINSNGLDRVNLVTFVDHAYPLSNLVLAVGLSTSFEADTLIDGRVFKKGEIFDADMVFNPSQTFTTTGGPGVDIQSVATHEAGHLFGISHSAIQSSTMFYVLPGGNAARSLESDDELVFFKAYGDPTALAAANRIDVEVRDGQTNDPVPGAIVFVIDTANQDTVGCDYTLPDGSATFPGLATGSYYVSIYPLNGTTPIGFIAPGNINVLVEEIATENFVPEFYDAAESNTDDAGARTPIAVGGGDPATASANIVTNIDATPPFVVSASPVDGTGDMAIDGAYRMQFSEPVNVSTLSGAFSFRDDLTSTAQDGNLAILRDDSVVVFIPSPPLDFSTAYTLTFDTDLEDKFGNPIESDFELSVTTEAEPPLSISSLAPSKGVVGTTAVINGQGFEDGASVDFGGVPAMVTSMTKRQIVTSVPVAAVSGLVTVTNPDLSTSNSLTFTVLSQAEVARGYESGQLLFDSTPKAIALTPDGDYAYVATDGGAEAIVVDPSLTNYLVGTSIAVSQGLDDVAATPSGQRVYGVGEGGSVLVEIMSDPTTGLLFNTILSTSPVGAHPRSIVVDPAGDRAYVTTDESNVQVWDIRLGSPTYRKQIGTIAPAGGVGVTGAMAMTPSGDRLLFATDTGDLVFYDPAAQSIAASVAVGLGARAVVTDPLGERAYVSHDDGEISVVNLQGVPFEVQDVVTGGSLRGFAITPGASYLYLTDRSLDKLDVVDLVVTNATFRSVVAEIPVVLDPVDVAISPDGMFAFSVLQGDPGSASPSLLVSTIGVGPTLYNIHPIAGPPGTIVVITGTDFGQAVTDATVHFNGASVPNAGSGTDGEILVAVPTGATTGQVTVEVEQLDGSTQISNPLSFQVLAPSSGSFRFAATLEPSVATGDQMEDDIAISPKGDVVFARFENSSVRAYDIRPGSNTFHRNIATFSPANRLVDFDITADGKTGLFYSFSAAGGNEVGAFVSDPNDPNFGKLRPISVTGFGAGGGYLRASPNNVHCLVYDNELNDVTLVDARDVSKDVNPQPGPVFTPAGSVQDFVFHPTGRTAYVAIFSPVGIQVVDTDPNSVTFGTAFQFLPLVAVPVTVALDVAPNGNSLYAYTIDTGGGANARRIHECAIGDAASRYALSSPVVTTVGTELPASFTSRDIRVSPRGDRAIRSSVEGFILYDVSTPATTISPTVGAGDNTLHNDFAFTPDGARVYVTTTNADFARVYDFATAGAILVASGNNQTGVGGAVLAASIRVRVTEPIFTPPAVGTPGVPVTFQASTGNGFFEIACGGGTCLVNELIVATDQDGFAEANWWLYPGVGPRTVEAIAEGVLGSPAVFTATAVADPSTLPLTVAEIIPLDNSTGVSVSTAALVTFSREIDAASIDPSSLFIQVAADATKIPVAFGFTDRNRRVSLTPLEPLVPSTDYEIVSTAGIEAESGGGPLSNPGTTTFETQAPPPLTLISIAPPSALPGTQVVISGRGFGAGANTVDFGTQAATGLGSSVSLLATVPTDAAAGVVNVTVDNGTSTSNALPFTILSATTVLVDDVIGSIGTSSGTKSVAVSADGALCYAVGTDGDVVIPVDIEGLTTFPAIPVGDQPVAIAINPAGTLAYVANFNSGTASVIDVDPDSPTFNTVVATITVGTGPLDLAITPDGARVVVANVTSSDLSIVDGNNTSATYHQVIGTIPTESGTKSVAISGDGTRIYLGSDRAVTVMEANSYGVLGTIPTESGTKSVAISGDGTLLFVLLVNGNLLIVDVQDGSASENEVIGTIGTGSGTKSVAVSADGTFLYLIQEDSDQVIVVALDVIPGVSVLGSDAAASFTIAVSYVDTLETGDDPSDVAVDPSGSGRVIVANEGDRTLTLYGPGFGPLEASVMIFPRTLNLKSNGKYVTGHIEVPAPYTAQEIVVASVRLQATIPAVLGNEAIEDTDGDGIDELIVKFDRAQFQAVLPEGEYVPVTVEGAVRDRTFVGEDTIRTLRPKVKTPHGGAHLLPGTLTKIEWTTPMGYSAQLADVHFTSDNGNTWEDVALQIPNTGSIPWTVPMLDDAPECRVMITLWKDGEIFGHGMNQDPFMVGSVVTVRLKSFDVAMEDGTAVLRWETSLEMGMEGYQIVRSEAETGRYDAITKELIRSSGEATGGSYEYRDESVTANRTYWYKLREVADDGLGSEYGPYSVTYRLTNQLDQNVPNPFNPTTTIRYAIASDNDVSLVVYDVSGRKVRTLVNERQKADVHRVVWDGVNDTGERVASGVYFYRLVAGKFTQTKKMLLLK